MAARAGEPLTAEELAEAQGLPVRFLRAILNDLRRVGIVTSQRGNEGGYKLARPASEITVGDVFRRLEGPLAEVRGMRPESASYEADAVHLQKVWVAVRACLRGVLDEVTLDQVVSGKLPNQIVRLVTSPGAWEPHCTVFDRLYSNPAAGLPTAPVLELAGLEPVTIQRPSTA